MKKFCPKCNGGKKKKMSKTGGIKKCKTCNGTGVINKNN